MKEKLDRVRSAIARVRMENNTACADYCVVKACARMAYVAIVTMELPEDTRRLVLVAHAIGKELRGIEGWPAVDELADALEAL